MSEEERRYYESEAKRKWQKENAQIISVKLMKNTDKDILDYISQKKEINDEFSVAGAFKAALREKINREKAED